MARKGGVSKTKAFRKADITEVEDQLAEARTEQQVTGGLIVEQSNDALFVVDKQGSDQLKRTSKQMKPLRLDEIVRPKSKIDVPAQKKIAKADEVLVKKKLQAALKGLGNKKPTTTSVSKSSEVKDLWADEVPMPKSIAKPPVKAKAVSLPAPGASYNPDQKDHEELMKVAAAQEIARLERIEKVKAALDIPLAPAPDTPNYDPETGMIYEDLFDEAEEQEEEPLSYSDEGMDHPSMDTVQKRKSKAERKQEAEQKGAEFAKQQAKLDAQVASQALHAKTLLKKVKEEERAAKKAQTQRAKARAARQQMMDGRKLGPNRFVKPAIEVKLPDELTGSLRTLKPEGNLLEDRFKALQEQAKIEPRVRRALKKRKFELKEYEKHSYKSFQ